jgi:hypothetical protein
MRKPGHKPDLRELPIECFLKKCPPKCRRVIKENFQVATIGEFVSLIQSEPGLSRAKEFTGRMIFETTRIILREDFRIRVRSTKQDRASMEGFFAGK